MTHWIHRVLDWAFPRRREADLKTAEATLKLQSALHELHSLNQELQLLRSIDMAQILDSSSTKEGTSVQ